jgi:HD superfamily phosphohydrolase/serine/threonine protein kinase
VSLEPFPQEYLRQLKSKYGERDDRKKAFAAESPKVLRYFEAVSARLSDTYTIDKVLAVGGTGIVHVGHHNRFHQPIVVKINRPIVEAEGVSMVEHEADVLPTLSHPNIIRVLDLGRLCVHLSGICDCDHTSETCDDSEECTRIPDLIYIVEPFITGSKPFFTLDKSRVEETWLHGKIEQLRHELPEALELGGGDDSGTATGLVTTLLANVAALFSQWVSLLLHVHSKHDLAKDGYVYLDVKPENVLVDEHLHLTSIDFGSVEPLDPEDHTPVAVFFTQRYAHPALAWDTKFKESSNRIQSSKKRSDLKCEFDHFALGTSMLQILSEIAAVRPHVVPQLPLYRSVHFLATRLLDGQNSDHPRSGNFEYAPQVFPGLRSTDYGSLGYKTLDDAHRDLEKERGRWSLEVQVPELAAYSKDIVRVVPGFNTVLTARLRGVMEHPLVARLKYVTQLGLVSLVYPTADHSRYDHALGSYTYTTYYVKSLFNDLGNPLFRNLVGKEDVNAVLLAALLHDLGQYPLAHDLEEVNDGIFNHGRIGMELLKDSMKDQRRRTLLEIIEDPQNGWAVSAEALRRIFGAQSKNLPFAEEDRTASLKTNVLAAIVDGQVDADKADYIIRDSARCELPYGAQLDIERLLRVLTVAILPQEPKLERRVSLGVYDKGLVSAHAFGQARYELLATVYWHHTSRIIKAMLQYATAKALPLDVFSPDELIRKNSELAIRARLLEFIKALVPPFDSSFLKETRADQRAKAQLDMAAEAPDEVIDVIEHVADSDLDEIDRVGQINWYPGIAWTDWLMLRWIAGQPDASSQSRNLIHAIQTRRLYKRVATFSRGGFHSSLIEKLDALSWPARVDLCRSLSQRVHERISRDWDRINTATSMSHSDFDKLSSSHLLILVDIPYAAKKTGYGRPLGVVPELKEKSYQQDTRQASEDNGWRNIMTRMIEGIAPVRVLCHPNVRNLVSSIYAPVETSMADLLSDTLRELQL